MSGVISGTLSVVTPNTTPPIDRDYARLHLRSISDVEDDLVDSWILAARDYWEEQTGRAIMHTTFDYLLDAFPAQSGTWPAKIELPAPPLVSVDGVSYVSGDGDILQVEDGASPSSDGWQVTAPAGLHAPRGWIEPLSGQTWPTPRVEAGAVRIRFTAGYAANPVDVPSLIKATLLLLVGQFDQFRSETHHSEGSRLERLGFGVDQMISAFKYTALPGQVLRSSWP